MPIKICLTCGIIYFDNKEFCDNIYVPEGAHLEALMAFITQYPEHKPGIDQFISLYRKEFHIYTEEIGSELYNIYDTEHQAIHYYRKFLRENYRCGKELAICWLWD